MSTWDLYQQNNQARVAGKCVWYFNSHGGTPKDGPPFDRIASSGSDNGAEYKKLRHCMRNTVQLFQRSELGKDQQRNNKMGTKPCTVDAVVRL